MRGRNFIQGVPKIPPKLCTITFLVGNTYKISKTLYLHKPHIMKKVRVTKYDVTSGARKKHCIGHINSCICIPLQPIMFKIFVMHIKSCMPTLQWNDVKPPLNLYLNKRLHHAPEGMKWCAQQIFRTLPSERFANDAADVSNKVFLPRTICDAKLCFSSYKRLFVQVLFSGNFLSNTNEEYGCTEFNCIFGTTYTVMDY